jgi:DNA gyrase subunit A
MAIPDFDKPGHYLMMATRKGLVKKTPLEDYSRPKKGGIIAIKLREDDELVDVVVCKEGDEVVMSTSRGQAIRFPQSLARAMGRVSSGVIGIRLRGDDYVVGMVIADPGATLLTVCAKGYGKRTAFGPNAAEGLGARGSGLGDYGGFGVGGLGRGVWGERRAGGRESGGRGFCRTGCGSSRSHGRRAG